MYRRYAIYDTCTPGSKLARFGAAWLGWDSAAGQAVAHPSVDVDVAALTQTPRKYGFHGTIKPPFRLADGQDAATLDAKLADFCATASPVVLEGLTLRRLGRFLALVPVGDAAPLGALAGRVVQAFDPFRAPPSEAELAKRRSANLSPAQEAHLTQWGYPYVLDQFRFHLTLTGRMPKADLPKVEAALAPLLADVTCAPYPITGLTLLGEDAEGRFHQISRHALTGAGRPVRAGSPAGV